MIRITRRSTLSAFAALALTACGGASGSNSDADATEPASSNKIVLQDVIFGDPDAPVTLVEYADWLCGACYQFHTSIMPTVKADYVESGQVKVVFREFPVVAPNVSVAGFAIARCAGDDEYYDVLDELFARQAAILTLARQGGPVVDALKQVAANHGIEGDEAFQACLDDPANRDAIKASVAAGKANQVAATPTFFLNGELMDQNARLSPQTFTAALDEALGPEAAPSVEPAVEAASETELEAQPSE